MIAAQYPTTGPQSGILQIVDLEKPEPAPGEVLAKVCFSGVNPTDWKSRGSSGFTAGAHPLVVPNQDGSGEIEAVGAGVDPARVGERVWIWQAQWQRPQGTAAQWIAVPDEHAISLPAGVSFELGAGLGIPAMTAHHCLFCDGQIAGDTVLVHGGAGAVGHAAIELARWAGARVATTVSSPEKGEVAWAAGADLVVDYRREDVVEKLREWAPHGVERIVEVDLPGNIDLDVAVSAPGATIVCYAAAPHGFLLPRELMSLNLTIRWMLVYTIPEEAKRAAVEDITWALGGGALTALPGPVFPLERISEAHDAVAGGAVGKVLVKVPGGC
ncbi:MAG TPA: NADPH:quinone reductase [Solirubrobacterales bacterium]|nr:NADPH:quinone reductase [Solirubrobacterales bacterium]